MNVRQNGYFHAPILVVLAEKGGVLATIGRCLAVAIRRTLFGGRRRLDVGQCFINNG
ncbi:MAG: hypothetical protein AAF614_28695 [Chloroflexota bacterium]